MPFLRRHFLGRSGRIGLWAGANGHAAHPEPAKEAQQISNRQTKGQPYFLACEAGRLGIEQPVHDLVDAINADECGDDQHDPQGQAANNLPPRPEADEAAKAHACT